MPTAIIIFGHGSTVEAANEAVRAVARSAAETGGWDLYETAFLEAEPTLAQAVENLAPHATEILVIPYFLTLGVHLRRDLPKLVEDLSRKYGVTIRVAPPLDGHPQLSRMLVDRAREHSA
jgi:sirohydrochlorin cobaltochelatase